MFGFFNKSQKSNFITVDIHSHLLPDIDDGVNSWEESIELVKQFEEIGYTKLITTPHIIHDYYPNKIVDIRAKVEQLNQLIKENGISLTIEAGAEYFLDQWFYNEVVEGKELLSFGDNYVLVETPFMNPPLQMKDTFFQLMSRGFRPVLAHPERYDYFINDYSLMHQYIDQGILLQINAASLTGYYSKASKKASEYLMNNDLVSFFGSDVHNQKHFDNYIQSLNSKTFSKLKETSILNNSL